jgi:hypothetical protein
MGWLPFTLQNYGTFTEGDTVTVEGRVVTADSMLCSGYPYHMIDNSIVGCEPLDLGCGKVTYDLGDYCALWCSPTYGCCLTYTDGYSPGTDLRLRGAVYSCGNVCIVASCIAVVRREICIPPAVQSKTWGRIRSMFR